jgi:ribosomal subunit interface protein
MMLEVQARDFTMTQAIHNFIERRLRFVSNTGYAHSERVRIRLSDINGPRGGCDKRCHLQVMLPGRTPVVIEDTQTNMYVAIDRAFERARRTLTRRLNRQRDKNRALSMSDRWPPGDR